MEPYLAFLVNTFGYMGILFVGVLSSVSIFLPSPAFVFIVAISATRLFDPFLVGFFAGLGAALGELTSYAVAFGGTKLASRKYNVDKRIREVHKYFESYGDEVIIFLFAISPLPFDIIGLFCGLVKYPIRKFFVLTLAGKLVKYWIIAYSGYYGFEMILSVI